MVAQRWQAAFCVGTPLGPETRLPMPSYEREVAVRQDPNYLPDSDSNNKNISDDNDETVHAESIPMIEQGDEKKQLKNMQVCPLLTTSKMAVVTNSNATMTKMGVLKMKRVVIFLDAK